MLNHKNNKQIKAPSPGLVSRLKIFRIFFKVWLFDGLGKKLQFAQILSFRSVLTTFLLFALAVPSYAYSRPKVVNGTLLYPIKRNLENIEYNLVDTETKKQEKEIKFAERRLDEVDIMLEDKKENKNIIETINETENIFVQIDSDLSKDGLKLDRHIEKITTIAQRAGLDDEPLTDSLATAIEEVKKVASYKKEENLIKPHPPEIKKIQDDLRQTEIDVGAKIKNLSGDYIKDDLDKLKDNLQTPVLFYFTNY